MSLWAMISHILHGHDIYNNDNYDNIEEKQEELEDKEDNDCSSFDSFTSKNFPIFRNPLALLKQENGLE